MFVFMGTCEIVTGHDSRHPGGYIAFWGHDEPSEEAWKFAVGASPGIAMQNLVLGKTQYVPYSQLATTYFAYSKEK